MSRHRSVSGVSLGMTGRSGHDDDAGTDPHAENHKSNHQHGNPVNGHKVDQADTAITEEYQLYLQDKIPDPRD